jgi:hypothetical protein
MCRRVVVAAVRLLAVLLFGFSGALGLFFGGLFTMSMIEEASLSKSIGVAAASALGPWLAVQLLVRRLRLPQTLSGLRPDQLAVLALGSAAATRCSRSIAPTPIPACRRTTRSGSSTSSRR